MAKILVIEDDATLRQGLTESLSFHGHTVFSAGDGRLGLELYELKKPELVVLDLMLPVYDGYDICRKIRARDENTALIILTARDQENDKLLGFELGADDYLSKPFSIRELLARIKALLKRSAREKETPPRLRVGEVEVLFRRFEITRGAEIMPMTPKETAILRLLSANSPNVVSRDRIIDRVWGDEYDPSPRTIDNFILKLRQKIEKDPARPRHLLTVHGAGYKLVL